MHLAASSRRLRSRSVPAVVRAGLLLSAAVLFVATDASAQQATLVKDIFPGVSSVATNDVTIDRIVGASAGKVFLNGWSEDGGGLWVADGGGIRLLLDISVLSAGADVDGTFFFGAVSQERGSLWKTDGTAAGTQFVKRFSPDPTVPAYPSKLTKVGNRLYFVVDDGVHGA